jgi:hypothetical protein
MVLIISADTEGNDRVTYLITKPADETTLMSYSFDVDAVNIDTVAVSIWNNGKQIGVDKVW